MWKSTPVVRWMLPFIVAGLCAACAAWAQDGARSQVYGFVMTDAGYNTEAIDPAWFDVQRPTKLPAFDEQFGRDGSTFFSVRQTRFGVKSWIPTAMGELKTQFEWEMFGVGVDAGQTTIRLRHAYGELGKWGVGQTWSPFMDIDVFPNTVEYWGPSGMAFFRNVQFRYMPIQGDTRMTLALERPGASADQGVTSEIVDFTGVHARFPVPDASAEYRVGRPWGYVEVAGIIGRMEWQDLSGGPTDISGSATRWGLNLSSNLKLRGGQDVVRLQLVHGEGIENYMNDAPVDVGTEPNNSVVAPIQGVALPVTGYVAFLDHTWNPKMSSSVGFSRIDIDNSAGQAPSAFKSGSYALANLMFMPVPSFMWGVEGGWIRRENNSDGFSIDNAHVQVSAKYNFSFNVGGE
jgi:hypothetical protein